MACGGDGCKQGRTPSRCNCANRGQWEDTAVPLKHGKPTGKHRPTCALYRVSEAVLCSGLLAWLVLQAIEGLLSRSPM